MDECKVCANADNEYCFACDNGNQFKPMTNADKLRSMTDEELAEWYWWMLEYLNWYTDSRAALRDWLRQEVEK